MGAVEPTESPQSSPELKVTIRGSKLRRWVTAVARQLLPRLLTLWLISIVTFGAMNAAIGNVALHVLGREATAEQVTAFQQFYGLDDPLYVQYGRWLGSFLAGDWGVSQVSQRPVREALMPRLGNTALLAIFVLALAVPLAVLSGVFLAKRPGSKGELSMSMGMVTVAAVPEFVIAIGFIYIFSVLLDVTPVDSSGLAFGDFGERIAAFILPALSLAVALVPHIGRMTRAAVRETLEMPYTRAAILRGLSRTMITWRYLVPNASAPVINVIALETMGLMTGVVIVENVFGFPGLGTLLVASIQNGDLISVQAIAMVTGTLFTTIGFVADLGATFFNPRLRVG